VVVGEAAVVAGLHKMLAGEVPVLKERGLAVAVNLDGTEIVVLHAPPLEVHHIVVAGPQVDTVTVVVAVLEDDNLAGRLVAPHRAPVVLSSNLSELLLRNGAIRGGILNKGQDDGQRDNCSHSEIR